MKPFDIEKIVVGDYLANCYLLTCPGSDEGVLIDAGGDADKILDAVNKLNCRPKYIICTHGHIDHISAAGRTAEGISPRPMLAIHEDDSEMLRDPGLNLAIYAGFDFKEIKPDILLEDGATLTAGGIRLKIIHTPGHTRGGISLISGGCVFTGDTLFASGIGRTDLPGGCKDELMESINKKLLSLEDDLRIYPGHGPESTIGTEKKSISKWI